MFQLVKTPANVGFNVPSQIIDISPCPDQRIRGIAYRYCLYSCPTLVSQTATMPQVHANLPQVGGNNGMPKRVFRLYRMAL